MVALVDQAEEHLQEGRYKQALRCLEEADPKKRRPEIQHKVRDCWIHMWRKAWKHSNLEQAKVAAQALDRMSEAQLALAQLRGPAAIAVIAQQDDLFGELAKARVETDVLQSLRKLRRRPFCQEWADGWIALYKEDHARALAAFQSVPVECPLPLQPGLGLTLILMGNRSEGWQALGEVTDLQARFPALRRLLTAETRDEQSNLWPDQEAREQLKLARGQSLAGFGWLREGDAQFLNDTAAAVRCWKEACNQGWSIDANKRLLTEMQSRPEFSWDDEAAWRLFIMLYEALLTSQPRVAREFLLRAIDNGLGNEGQQHLIFEVQGKDRFTTPEWMWLLSHAWISKDHVEDLAEAFVPVQAAGFMRALCQRSEQYLNRLGPLADLPQIAKTRISHAFATRRPALVRKVVMSILDQSGDEVDDFLAWYRRALSEDENLNQKEVKEEVQRLFHRYPTSPEVLHLAMEYLPMSPGLEVALERQSAPMRAILRAVPVLKKGARGASKALKEIPDLEALREHPDALWRWIIVCLEYRLSARAVGKWLLPLVKEVESQCGWLSRLRPYGVMWPSWFQKKIGRGILRLYMEAVSVRHTATGEELAELSQRMKSFLGCRTRAVSTLEIGVISVSSILPYVPENVLYGSPSPEEAMEALYEAERKSAPSHTSSPLQQRLKDLMHEAFGNATFEEELS